MTERILWQTSEAQLTCDGHQHVLQTNDGAVWAQGKCACSPLELWELPKQEMTGTA